MSVNVKERKGLVTVAMPIFNEEKYIQETLESVVGQSYENLEILISDNASTDRTGAICRECARKDRRIKYHRQAGNIGAAENYFYLVNRAQGEYFVTISGHDKWSPDLVAECVKLLTDIPTATVAYGTPVWIGERGEFINKKAGWYDSRGCNVISRFFSVFWGDMNPVLGIFRYDKLPRFARKDSFVGLDLALLADMAIKGEFLHATKAVFYRRRNRPAEDYRDKLNRYKSKDVQIARTVFSRSFPLVRLPFELLRIVVRSDIEFLDKIFIIMLLAPSFPIRYILGKRDNKKK